MAGAVSSNDRRAVLLYNKLYFFISFMSLGMKYTPHVAQRQLGTNGRGVVHADSKYQV